MSRKEQPWEQGIYETGRTQPPKSHVGLIAFLLAVVIFLGGLTSALGVLNIRLFAQLQEQQDPDVAFVTPAEENDATAAALPETSDCRAVSPELGITGEALDEFYQRYYRLPQGLWVTAVEPDSGAEKAGIQPIDILLSLNGTAIADQQSLQNFLSRCKPGEILDAVIFRGGEEIKLPITVG